jgi:hypothetical protein
MIMQNAFRPTNHYWISWTSVILGILSPNHRKERPFRPFILNLVKGVG